MDENMELQNHLLVAMPSLRDPNFAGTVVYITGHDEKGSRGFVINRQTELMLSDVLEQSKVIAKGSASLSAVRLIPRGDFSFMRRRGNTRRPVRFPPRCV